MESLGRPISTNSNKKHENVNVVLGSDSHSAECSAETDSSPPKHTRGMDANKATEESETISSEQPLTPLKEKETAKVIGTNASPMTPWTVRSDLARDLHGWSLNRAEKPWSGTPLEHDTGFTFAPSESVKTVETSGDDVPSDACLSFSKAACRRDPRLQSVRRLRFNVSADTVLAPISAYADHNGSELHRGALIFPSLQPKLGPILHQEKQPNAESEEHSTNGSLDDERVAIMSKVSDGTSSETGHSANRLANVEEFSIARVSNGENCGGKGYSASNGSADEIRVSVSDALREEAFVEETRISFLGAIVSKQYEDAGLNPPNGEAGDDSSHGPDWSVPTTPTTPSSRYISVPDTCPGAPLREGVRSRLPARDLSSVRRKLEF